MHAMREDYAVHDVLSMPFRGKNTFSRMRRHVELLLFVAGSHNFTNRGCLISSYHIVPTRPLAFNVSCIFCSHTTNNDQPA